MNQKKMLIGGFLFLFAFSALFFGVKENIESLMANSLKAKDVKSFQHFEWILCKDADEGVLVVYKKQGQIDAKVIKDKTIKKNGVYGTVQMTCDEKVPKANFVACELNAAGTCENELVSTHSVKEKWEKKEEWKKEEEEKKDVWKKGYSYTANKDVSVSVEVSEFDDDYSEKVYVDAEDPYLSVSKTMHYKIVVTNNNEAVKDVNLHFYSSYDNTFNGASSVLCPSDSECTLFDNAKSVKIENLPPQESYVLTYSRSFGLHKKGMIFEKAYIDNGPKDVAVVMVKK